jgi:hypothetical protein
MNSTHKVLTALLQGRLFELSVERAIFLTALHRLFALDQNGNPICSELRPGKTADVKTLVPVVERLKGRFGIGSVCIVPDRGMISAETLAEVELREWPYILGVCRGVRRKPRRRWRAPAAMRTCIQKATIGTFPRR